LVKEGHVGELPPDRHTHGPFFKVVPPLPEGLELLSRIVGFIDRFGQRDIETVKLVAHFRNPAVKALPRPGILTVHQVFFGERYTRG
jgi:hypothetical protein